MKFSRLHDWVNRSRGALLCKLPSDREKKLHRRVVILGRALGLTQAKVARLQHSLGDTQEAVRLKGYDQGYSHAIATLRRRDKHAEAAEFLEEQR